MEWLRPFFPKSHGKPRVDDRRVLSGIVFVNRNGLRWRGGRVHADYGRACGGGSQPETVMIDATYLKAHRMASSLWVKRGISAV